MNIDYYGDKDNYIHLKWGDVKKAHNFTEEFRKDHPDFVREYASYLNEEGKFKNPFQIVSYVFEKNIPVHFYFNFTDEPATCRDEIINYLVREQSYIGDL